MKPEIWVAIYAAIVGSCALLLNFKSWLDSAPKLIVHLIPEGQIIGGDPKFDEKEIVIVNVTNRGATGTTVTNLTLHEFPSRYSKWRDRPIKSYVIANPQLKGYPPNIPADLEPNKKWTGIVRRRQDYIADLHTGNFY